MLNRRGTAVSGRHLHPAQRSAKIRVILRISENTFLPFTIVVYEKKKLKLYFQVSGNNQHICPVNNVV